ncbi:MAG: hypothetical protein M1818_002164 [Claussenomyces sp. TS43310]|nr:MAG: hypothetical protein M1818_002164 [Claussenomyces sp. TS43310]
MSAASRAKRVKAKRGKVKRGNRGDAIMREAVDSLRDLAIEETPESAGVAVPLAVRMGAEDSSMLFGIKPSPKNGERSLAMTEIPRGIRLVLENPSFTFSTVDVSPEKIEAKAAGLLAEDKSTYE